MRLGFLGTGHITAAMVAGLGSSDHRIRVSRTAWRQVAERVATSCIEIEVVCSDIHEHRRRVETRGVPPTWDDVMRRTYEPWDGRRIDTANRTVAGVGAELRSMLQR